MALADERLTNNCEKQLLPSSDVIETMKGDYLFTNANNEKVYYIGHGQEGEVFRYIHPEETYMKKIMTNEYTGILVKAIELRERNLTLKNVIKKSMHKPTGFKIVEIFKTDEVNDVLYLESIEGQTLENVLKNMDLSSSFRKGLVRKYKRAIEQLLDDLTSEAPELGYNIDTVIEPVANWKLPKVRFTIYHNNHEVYYNIKPDNVIVSTDEAHDLILCDCL